MFEPVGPDRKAERVAPPRVSATGRDVEVGAGAASRHPGLEQRPSVRAELAIAAMLNAARGGVARADAPARSAPVQRKAIEFEGHTLDTSDMASFRSWCIVMARVHPERLHALMNHLFRQTSATPGAERVPSDERAAMLAVARQVLDAAGSGDVLTVPTGYEHILSEVMRLGNRLTDRARGIAWETIRAAALIDANAAAIAAAGAEARQAVQQFTGDMPSTGFVGESEDTVRMRAAVVLSAWRAAGDDDARVALLSRGFGNAPCLAARLNGIAEYRAGQEGLTEEALSDARYSVALGGQILNLAYAFFGDDDDTPDWGAFRTNLQQTRPDITGHLDFEPSFTAARSGF